MWSRALALLPLLGCGSPARVTIDPINGCGPAVGANTLSVTAFTGGVDEVRSVPLDRAVDIGDFPADTTQLAVEVVIGGGVVGAAGKTAPLAYGELADGTAIPIYMGTLGGFCPTAGEMLAARRHPLVAAAGDGALVLGGLGEAGQLVTAEYYDRATSTFSSVAVPAALQDSLDLTGSSLAPLPDGRVAVSRGGVVAVFDPDPARRGFGPTSELLPPRAFHGSVALDAERIIVAGGCSEATCALALKSTFVVDLSRATLAVAGPPLDPDAASIGAQLFDTGAGFVLAGGTGTPGEAHRFTLVSPEAELLTGLAGQVAALDGGALLTAFAADGAAATNAVVGLGPGGARAPLGAGPALAGARLATAEDGSVYAFGGDPEGVAGNIAHYIPTRDGWEVGAPIGEAPGNALQPGTLDAPAIVRLADGSLLVLGGEAAPSKRAWIFRPPLVGPTSGSVTAVPTNDSSSGVLTPVDPNTLARTANTWVLTGPVGEALPARALVGGPRMRRGSVRATFTVTSGGFALIAQQVAPDRALVARVVPGEVARLDRLEPGGATTVCSSTDPVDLAPGTVTAGLVVADGSVTLVVRRATDPGDVTLIACDHRAVDTGAWGIAAAPGSQIAVSNVTAAH